MATVMIPAPLRRLTGGQARLSVSGGDIGSLIHALDQQLAHVRQVEQSRPLPDAAMLLEDRSVLHRHPPTGEVDHAGAQRLMATGQWCFVDDAACHLREGHEASSARMVARIWAAWATSPRSVSKVSMVGASSKSIQRTSSNS